MTDQEINEAVARKLGKVIRENKDFRNPFEVIRREPDDHSISYEEIPPYATDISAAWEVWERLSFGVNVLSLSTSQGKTFWVTFTSMGEQWSGPYADTAPKAICLAFLKLETVEPLK